MPFHWGVSFHTRHRALHQESHRLSSLAMHKQCDSGCEYKILNFFSRAASLGCLAVKQLELDAHSQAFARND